MKQAGGAYIFRPTAEQTPIPVNKGSLAIEVVEGAVVTEVCVYVCV